MFHSLTSSIAVGGRAVDGRERSVVAGLWILQSSLWEKARRCALFWFRSLRGRYAALPAVILWVVELSTLKVRIPGGPSSSCESISLIFGYCSRW